MLDCPSELFDRDKDLAQARVDHGLARVQTRDPCNRLLVLKDEMQHRTQHLSALDKCGARPLDLGIARFRNAAVNVFCGRGVDAPKGFASRRGVALDQR